MWKAFIQTVTNEYCNKSYKTSNWNEKLMAQYIHNVKLIMRSTNVYGERYCINKLHLLLRSGNIWLKCIISECYCDRYSISVNGFLESSGGFRLLNAMICVHRRFETERCWIQISITLNLNSRYLKNYLP